MKKTINNNFFIFINKRIISHHNKLIDMEQSKKYSLNFRNVIKGLILAVVAGVLTLITTSTLATISWQLIGYAALTSASSYLLTTFFQGEKKDNGGVK